MTTSLVVDIWNEPDLSAFWGTRTQTQYLQMWGRTYYKFRYVPWKREGGRRSSFQTHS